MNTLTSSSLLVTIRKNSVENPMPSSDQDDNSSLKQTPSQSSDMQEQMENLETKVAYLEHHIEELNDALVELQLDNKTAKDALKYLYQQVQSIGGSQGGQTSSNFVEPPPPHY